MITNGVLFILQGVINILLSPLTLVNIGVDFIASIPVISSFISVVAYVLPWNNLLPLFALSIILVIFRTTLGVIKVVLDFIPFI